MTTTTKAILVLASAGEGSSASVPQGLLDYCAALATAAPTSSIRTEERGQDLAQLNMAASVKSTQVNESQYSVTMDWTPLDYHMEDEEDPSVWLSSTNGRGIKYGATVNSTNYFVFVQMAN